jgi:hypothetical protein
VQYLNGGEFEEYHSNQKHLGCDPELLVEVVGANFDQPISSASVMHMFVVTKLVIRENHAEA